MLKLLDLFSGIGGFSLAAHWTGQIETVAFCEIESYATKVLNKNFPGIPVESDIKELKNNGQYGSIDIICGGFPCQPFSVAGKQRGKDDDRDLWPEMLRVINEFKPAWVIGENVAGFVNMELERTVTDLETEGYETQSFIIPACGVDAKHERKRVWIVSYSGHNARSAKQKQQCEMQTKEPRRVCDIGVEPRPVLAHSASAGWQWTGITRTNETENKKRSADITERAGEVLANSDKQGSQGWDSRELQECASEWPARQEDPRSENPSAWQPEPGMGRVANGVSRRVDRLKCLGNSIVPQVVYPILKSIVDIEIMTLMNVSYITNQEEKNVSNT